MTYTTLQLKGNLLKLPVKWTREFSVKDVVATWLGDVLILRPIKSVVYSPRAEKKALKAIESYNKDKRAGRIKKLESKLSDLLK